MYDLATGQLRKVAAPKKYPKPDLFKDLDTDYVESKLSDLELHASMIVRTIHNTLHVGEVTLPRTELSLLRKFIFVTHYRSRAVYLQESDLAHGEEKASTLSQQWMERWLQGLKYYLDNRHDDIVSTTERLMERYGKPRLSNMLKSGSYPDNEKVAFQYAFEYAEFADNYFLGIWIADSQSEFVLSGDTFSFWEGLISGVPEAHRIHILSPRIAIVLRRTCLHNSKFNSPSVLHSSLADVPIHRPRIRYFKEDLIDMLEANPDQAKSVMSAYKTTPDAELDSFKYSFTRLNAQQTYAVNEVILMNTNLRPHGSLIFRQSGSMRKTLHLYIASPNTYLGGKQRLFRPLLAELRSQGPVRSSSPSDSESESSADCQLSILLNFMNQNHVSFPSPYTRALLIYHMATLPSTSNLVALRIREVQDAAISKLQCFLDPPLPEELSRASSYNGLVKSLASEESELFFSLITSLLDQAVVIIRRSNDFYDTVINEAAIVGVTYWLAEERPDILKDKLLPWVDILA